MTKARPETPAERRERLAEIRRQIAAGTYETADKLAVAVERLCDDMTPPAPRKSKPR